MFQRVSCSIHLISGVVLCGLCIHEGRDGLGTVAVSAGTELLAENSPTAPLQPGDPSLWLLSRVQGLGTGCGAPRPGEGHREVSHPPEAAAGTGEA